MKETKRAENMKSDSFERGVQTCLYQKFLAFTLAEMMVVLLILSIVLAAMAPVMTTRIKRDMAGGQNGANSIWQWSQNNNGVAAYFGADANQTAMIGQTDLVEGENSDPPARLVINASETRHNHILFKNGNDVLGRLTFQNNSLVLGTGSIEGSYNTAIGVGALSSNTTGAVNTASGYQALYSNKEGRYNVASGYQALYSNKDGGGNTASGSQALYSNKTGSGNTASGNAALYSNTEGSKNTASGSQALYSNKTGSGNTASGYQALYSNTEGSNNIAIGTQALYNNRTETSTDSEGEEVKKSGADNIALGTQALYANTIGNNNIAHGTMNLYKNTTGWNNIALGYQVLYNNTTGQNNIANGFQAMYSNTTGNNNIALGYQALYSNTKGYNNTAIGEGALYSNTKGDNNTAIGVGSLRNNDFTNGNTAIGYNALYNTSAKFIQQGVFIGGYNTAIGYYSLYSNTSGSSNIASGNLALYSNTTGDNNIASGYRALQSNTTGSNNTAIGSEACRYVLGSNKTCIGASSGPESGHDWAQSTDNTERIFIGSKSKFNYGPAVLEVHNIDDEVKIWRDTNSQATVNASGVVVNGNLYVKGAIVNYPTNWNGISAPSHPNKNNVDIPAVLYDGDDPINWPYNEVGKSDKSVLDLFYNKKDGMSYYRRDSGLNYSDRRLKYVGKEFTSGLDKIRQLKVFNYTFKKDEKKTPRVGVIAQDLQKIFPNAVTKGADGFLTIRMEDMFYALVNAVKELDAKVTAMAADFAKQKELLFSAQKDINTLKKENKELKAQNKKLEARLNALEAKLK